ncbi:hypothetical protein BJY19_002158 [Arthrobacter cupressi]|nr:hypothetical protein [Arthrobacter cupressi]
MPTADPVILSKRLHALVPSIHEGLKYVRAGIMVKDLRPSGNQPPLQLFENPTRRNSSARFWKTSPNASAADPSASACQALKAGGPDWSMKRAMLSPRYTTEWAELPIVKAA